MNRSGSIGIRPGSQDRSSLRAGSAQERPGVRRSDQNRRQVMAGSDERNSSHAWLVREPSLECFFDETCRFSALSLCVRTLRSTAPASKNEGLAYRSARRGGRTTCPRKTTKIDRKIDPKSIEVGRLGYVETPESIELARAGPVKAPKSIEAARSRSVEAAKVARLGTRELARVAQRISLWLDSLGNVVIDLNRG